MAISIRKIKNTAHLMLASIASVYNKFPSKDMTVIGVTGTDGKTTTANLINHILYTAGYKTAIISTVGANINAKKYETGLHVTTPSPFKLQKYLKIAKNKGCTFAIIEVTSHALDQNRVWGIKFHIGVLTNITHEHLDYHKSYKEYVKAKLRLLKMSDIAIVNSDGEWMEEVKKTLPLSKLKTYSLTGTADSDLKDNELSLLNMPFKLKTNLIGDFNKENILASVLVARVLGISNNDIDQAVQNFVPPSGRQQVIKSKSHGTIIVDFAHTPNAFDNILFSIRKMTTGKVIHVFGSAGERDSKKRGEMGKIASFYDDIIVLTQEDPRSEKVEDINKDIISGINKKFEEKNLYKINDRKKAIEFAIGNSASNDTVILTGKGHEKSMNLGHGEESWDELKVVEEYLKNYD